MACTLNFSVQHAVGHSQIEKIFCYFPVQVFGFLCKSFSYFIGQDYLLIMADKQVFILEGDQPDQKKMFEQWYDEGPKGPPGLLNKLRCEGNLDVPKDIIEAGGKEFIYNSKSNRNQLPLRAFTALMYSS